MSHPIRYTPSPTIPAPMLTPGTRAVHLSKVPTKQPGAAAHNGTAAARASQRRAVKQNVERTRMNRKAAKAAREPTPNALRERRLARAKAVTDWPCLVRSIMAVRRLSIGGLAEDMGVSKRAASYWLAGNPVTGARAEALIDMAQAHLPGVVLDALGVARAHPKRGVADPVAEVERLTGGGS